MCRQVLDGLFYCIDALIMVYVTAIYSIYGFLTIVRTFVLDYIESIEYPWFVRCRKFVKKCLRMTFWDKTYPRFTYDEEHTSKGNTYIDKMLEMFHSKEYDPYTLEDSIIGFNKKIIFVNVSGEAKLHDGEIKGLGTLHRAADCSLHKEEAKLKVRAELGAGELEFHYKGSIKFMNFGPTIAITGVLPYIKVFMEFKVNSTTGNNGRLTKFVIDDMRGMIVKVSGLGPLNWAVNSIVSGVTKVFKRFVRNFMEDKVEKHLQKHIPNYQFPVEGGETPETTTQSETNLPEKIPEIETTEETPAPETETSVHEPKGEAFKFKPETPEPDTEAPAVPPEHKHELEESLDVDINFPETPETSNGDESVDVGALEELESNS